MFQDLLRQALVEIARGHEEELCRVTEALRTENASLVGQLARLQMDLGSASQLPSADAPPKPPPLDMPNAGVDLPGTLDHGEDSALEAVANFPDESKRRFSDSSANESKRRFSDRSSGSPSDEPRRPSIRVLRPSDRQQSLMSSTLRSNEGETLLFPPGDGSQALFPRLKTKSPCLSPADTMEDEHATVQLQQVWKLGRVASKRDISSNSNRRISIGSHTLGKQLASPSYVEPPEAERSSCCSCLNCLVIYPGSNKRAAFEVFGLLMIFYDLLWWPAQVFGYTSVPVTRAILWLSSAFWPCDLLMTFFVGFTIHDQGLIEMRVSKIARHYAMTWLPIDLLLVLLDWTLNLLMLLSDDGVADFGGGVFLEKVQYLRLLRLLRLFKATNIISVLSDRIQSETMRILVRVLKLLVFIMLINHLIACSWYAVGINDLEREDTWVKANDLKGKGTVYAYTSILTAVFVLACLSAGSEALHWSITQFTPASMEVVPMNELERSFTIVVIVSAMVIFSSFISTITNAMTQLRNLNSERNAELVKLRRFFSERKVSASLVARISSCIHQSNKLISSRVHCEDISILELLPVSLKCDLAEEVFAPTLCAHPFILTWGEYYPKESKRLFLAARSSSLGAKHELFNTGQVAESMYFVSSGAMVYIRDAGESADIPTFVSPGQWLAEPALWIKWKHVGHASSTEKNCELVSFHCEAAIRVLSQNTSAISGARRYAKAFAAYFAQQSDKLSDLWADMDVLEIMVSAAFIKHEKELLRQAVANTVMKDTRGPGSMRRMKSQHLTSRLDEIRVDQDEHKKTLTALNERLKKYNEDGPKRKEIFGIRSEDSDESYDVVVPISNSFRQMPEVLQNPQRTSSSGRGILGLSGLPGIASAFRIL
ncbi:unnamed protein product, partial [Polarella glacialis]